MRMKFLTWLAAITYKRYLSVFTACLLITVLFGYFAGQIRMEMTWGSLVPDGEPSKETFNQVIDNFGAATQIVIALEGERKERLYTAAEELAVKLRNVTVEIPSEEGEGSLETIRAAKRVQTRLDTAFIAKHGMMLIKAKDLRNQGKAYTDYNLVQFLTNTNDVLESEYVQNTDNLTKQENESVRALDGLYDFVESIGKAADNGSITRKQIDEAVNAMTIGNGYFLSTDKKMLLIFLTPTISLNVPIDQTVAVVNAIDEAIVEFLEDNPDVSVGMTGGHVITRDEMEAGFEDIIQIVTFAFIIILLIFMVSFRMISGPLLAMVVLIAGITWDIGLAYLVFGRLNIMTAMTSVVLVGLGVDFAIHILSAYSEFKYKGMDTEKALLEAFRRIGTGLITGAITTSAAFLALLFTSYSTYREFGFVVGTGIIFCLIASLFFLPSVLVMKEKLWGRFRKKTEYKLIEMEFKTLGRIADFVTVKPWVTITVVLIITIVAGYYSQFIYMNQNYMDMEPEGLESVRLQREIPKRFNMSPDNMFAVFDSLEEVNRVTDVLNERPAIGYVESISEYLPSNEKQEGRIPEVIKIRNAQDDLPAPVAVNTDELTEQLYRFSDNLTEMSSLAFINGLDKVFDKTNFFLGLDEEGEQTGRNRVTDVIEAIENSGNGAGVLRDYQRMFRTAMKNRITGMANPEIITLDMVPQERKERFLSNDGTQYLIAIYSKKDIWDGLLTTPFLTTILDDVPEASGMPVLIKAMIRTAKEEGAFALMLTFIAFFVILIIDFRSLKTAIFASIPLILGMIWMLGIMGLTQFPFSVVNVIGLPLILGIGIDDGVHIIHRYKIEGKLKIGYTVSSIGKAIFLTSLTTMLGFGSLIPSSYRGYASLGTLVALGIGLCFITSVIILPAFLKLIWGGKKDHKDFFSS